MLFNSLPFLIFLPIVFAGYWMLNRNLKLQNLFVVVASYVFYGWWDWRFLVLMTFTSVWSWGSGLAIEKHRDSKLVGRWIVALALIVNLTILGIFKYYNFFVESFSDLLSALHLHLLSTPTLSIILPVGISFYTFQALSFVIDVYRDDIKPTKDLVAFLAFVSFFPQLVAGPIERATNLMPQFLKSRQFEYPLAVEGCRQMLWGFCKKIILADSCACAANELLACANPSCISLWAGVIMFTFQIYGDFSGYSDIAIGCSKLFGIRLMRNFAHPYFARDIAEFWRRWHISLTTWFRDYLYIPLGGSRCGNWKKVRNTFVIFLVSGFWHGANWTFVLWGAFHAACFLPLLLLNRNRKYTTSYVAEGRLLPSVRELFGMLSTFFLAVVGWTLFRAPNITTAFSWFRKMFAFNDFHLAETRISSVNGYVIAAIVIFVVIEWFNRMRDIPALPRAKWLRIVIYYVVIFAIFYWDSSPQTFIYFQF